MAPVTSTVSVTCPVCSVTSTRATCATCSATPRAHDFGKPALSAVTVYSPGLRLGMT